MYSAGRVVSTGLDIDEEYIGVGKDLRVTNRIYKRVTHRFINEANDHEKELNLFFFENGVVRITTHYVEHPDKRREIFLSKETVHLILDEILAERGRE